MCSQTVYSQDYQRNQVNCVENDVRHDFSFLCGVAAATRTVIGGAQISIEKTLSDSPLCDLGYATNPHMTVSSCASEKFVLLRRHTVTMIEKFVFKKKKKLFSCIYFFLFQNFDTSESKLRREFEVYGPVKKVGNTALCLSICCLLACLSVHLFPKS